LDNIFKENDVNENEATENETPGNEDCFDALEERVCIYCHKIMSTYDGVGAECDDCKRERWRKFIQYLDEEDRQIRLLKK